KQPSRRGSAARPGSCTRVIGDVAGASMNIDLESIGVRDLLFIPAFSAVGLILLRMLIHAIVPSATRLGMLQGIVRLLMVPIAFLVTVHGGFDAQAYYSLSAAGQGFGSHTWLGTEALNDFVFLFSNILGLCYFSCFLPFWFISSAGGIFLL